jgi:1-deoxy-D-xylulose-5-phosphate reductoisomerase
MNKGLEMIEAKWLFNLPASQIQVCIHPQSIVHSLVHFEDGSIKAQLSLPDMRLPIQYALSYPYRLKNKCPRFSFPDYSSLTFFSPDEDVFRSLPLAYRAVEQGGNVPCAMNAANEIAVNAFIEGKLPFLQIAEITQETMEEIVFIEKPSMEDVLMTDETARLIANNKINKRNK